MSEKIGTRTFTADDLLWFANASGDWNPIHVDPVLARRFLAGGVVVHGMYSLLWALDCHFAAKGTLPKSVTASFTRSILPGESLKLNRAMDGDDIRLSITRGRDEVTVIVLKGAGMKIDGNLATHAPVHMEPQIKTFDALKGATGDTEVSASLSDLSSGFPAASKALGAMPVASIMALSRIVGMECPGLHSLFTGIDITFDPSATDSKIHWQVIRHTSPHAPLKIEVKGGGLIGKLDAFVRPEPVTQPGMAEIAKLIEPGVFAGQHALVIGGSRGLGELVAKIVAAGGGEVVITYNSGVADAGRVVEDIVQWGGKCRALHSDMKHLETLLHDAVGTPTHVYYFATPRITSHRGDAFDDAMYEAYNHIYVHAFQHLAVLLAKKQPGDIRIFYPSSVFVTEVPRDFAEYIAAKSAGEALCHYLNKNINNIHICISRLPRLKTDQTASLLPVASKPALQEMERVVRQMHDFKK